MTKKDTLYVLAEWNLFSRGKADGKYDRTRCLSCIGRVRLIFPRWWWDDIFAIWSTRKIWRNDVFWSWETSETCSLAVKARQYDTKQGIRNSRGVAHELRLPLASSIWLGGARWSPLFSILSRQTIHVWSCSSQLWLASTLAWQRERKSCLSSGVAFNKLKKDVVSLWFLVFQFFEINVDPAPIWSIYMGSLR